MVQTQYNALFPSHAASVPFSINKHGIRYQKGVGTLRLRRGRRELDHRPSSAGRRCRPDSNLRSYKCMCPLRLM